MRERSCSIFCSALPIAFDTSEAPSFSAYGVKSRIFATAAASSFCSTLTSSSTI